MERDAASHTSGTHSPARSQPSSTWPTRSPCSSQRGSSPSSGQQDPSSPRTGPLRQTQVTLPSTGDLRPQFRLRPGHDDALIGWLGSLSPRHRSRAIRTALCQYLNEQRDPLAAERREDPDLAHALDSLF